MQCLNWTPEQLKMAQSIVVKKFNCNSVAKQFIPEVQVDWTEATVPRKRFNYQRQPVIDYKVIQSK